MLRRVLTGGVLVAVVVLAVAALVAPPAEAGRCVCPKIYAPVICDNGHTYVNPCMAECRNAKNCVPTGEL